MTLYLSVLDDRIRCAVISGFLNTFRQTFFAVEHCNCGTCRASSSGRKTGDLAAAIAPTLLLVEAGKRDRGFPLAGALEGYAIARRADQGRRRAGALRHGGLRRRPQLPSAGARPSPGCFGAGWRTIRVIQR